MLSAICFNLDQSTILSSGNGLRGLPEHDSYTGISPISIHQLFFNFLPKDRNTDSSKIKAFADENANVAQKLEFAFDRVENIVRKGENAGYQHFLLFPHCFQNFVFQVC